jgi:hypothetical protein
MCIDAIQFSDPPLTALGERRRILASGGRLAVTAWEPTRPADERLPERTRRMNLARRLAEAGFEQIEVTGNRTGTQPSARCGRPRYKPTRTVTRPSSRSRRRPRRKTNTGGGT